MRGRHPEKELIPYLRGELTGESRDRVRAHLTACGACLEQSAALSKTLDSIARKVAELPLPDWTSYRRELRLKLNARQVSSTGWWRWAALGGSLVGAAVAALAIFSVYPAHRTTLTTPAVEQLALADVNVDLLRNYTVVEDMEMLEHYDVIEHLDELQDATSQIPAVRPL